MSTKKIPIVVTTAHRGIFVGYAESAELRDDARITLTDARMVVYYSRETRGVLGIGSRGVGASSRVSPKVPRLQLRDVTAVWEATSDAAAAWEAEPWS